MPCVFGRFDVPCSLYCDPVAKLQHSGLLNVALSRIDRISSMGVSILWALVKVTDSKWHLSSLVKDHGWAGLGGFQEQHHRSRNPEAGKSAVCISFLLLL